MYTRLIPAALMAVAFITTPVAVAQQAEARSLTRTLQGSVNPYLWRASLDTLDDLPLLEQPDPIGGVIVYDWFTFETAPNERIKATVFILDTRLRADGVKVSVFRQEQIDGQWVDAAIDPSTPVQLENKILERARLLKTSEVR